MSHDFRRRPSLVAGSLSRSSSFDTIGIRSLFRRSQFLWAVSTGPTSTCLENGLVVTDVPASNHARHGTTSDATLLVARSQGGVTCRASYRRIDRLKQSCGTCRSHAGHSCNPGDRGLMTPFQHSLACRVHAGFCGVEAEGFCCTLTSNEIV